MHKLLVRQLRRFFGGANLAPPELRQFLEAVDAAYAQADEDRILLERSLELTSQDLIARNEELRMKLMTRQEK